MRNCRTPPGVLRSPGVTAPDRSILIITTLDIEQTQRETTAQSCSFITDLKRMLMEKLNHKLPVWSCPTFMCVLDKHGLLTGAVEGFSVFPLRLKEQAL